MGMDMGLAASVLPFDCKVIKWILWRTEVTIPGKIHYWKLKMGEK